MAISGIHRHWHSVLVGYFLVGVLLGAKMEDMVYETDKYTFFWNPAGDLVRVYAAGFSPLDPSYRDASGYVGDFLFDSEEDRAAFEIACDDWVRTQ
jgi:hypothetical protein